VQLTWPHAQTDWAPILAEAEACFIQIAKAISLRENLIIVSPEPDAVKAKLAGIEGFENILFVEAPTNDTWARDHGGITVMRGGKPVILDFMFNGWGLKFAANHDNLITRRCFDAGVFSGATYENRLNFIVEGGSLESDGMGTLLTTSECLLSLNRNGEWSKKQIGEYLRDSFNLAQILWLDHGYLAGDDTDSHIDTLARLCPRDTIIYVKCDDESDEHFEALSRMEKQLHTFRTIDGRPYRLVPVPLPDAVVHDGERLPATYANFLIINKAVLLPVYSQPQKDEEARRALASVFPDREVICIDCSVLVKQHGSLHCVTMQYPEGVIK
jgi:agmatine/peptidylarginine deiminase